MTLRLIRCVLCRGKRGLDVVFVNEFGWVACCTHCTRERGEMPARFPWLRLAPAPARTA